MKERKKTQQLLALELHKSYESTAMEKITANAPKTPGGDAQKQKRIFLKREDLQPVFSFKIVENS